MRPLQLLLVTFFLLNVIYSATLCAQKTSETWGQFVLSNYTVSGASPLHKNDQVDVKFSITYTGSSSVKLGSKGIYLHTNFGDYKITDTGFSGGERKDLTYTLTLNGTGAWTVQPVLCISSNYGDVCHVYNSSCSLDVFVKCPQNTVCISENQASQGNYVKVSEEPCGYTLVGGMSASNKVMLYCYRETASVPEGCICTSQGDAEKRGLVPCGGSKELQFCGMSNGVEQYSYQNGYPDLTISDVWPLESQPGAYSELRALVFNKGNGYANPSKVKFYVNGERVGEAEIERLAPGENTVARLSYQRPCANGTNELRAIVDPEDEITETSESNNELTKSYECVENTTLPNLNGTIRVTYLNQTCGIVDYRNLDISILVYNLGRATSPQARATVYIDGNYFGDLTIHSLTRNNYDVLRITPNTMCSGTRDEIRVVIDSGGEVTESNESDNEVSIVIPCVYETNTSDLVITNVTLETVENYGPTNIPLKSKVHYTINNSGRGFACNFYNGLYVSKVYRTEDSMESMGETLIAHDWIESLAPGQSVERVFAVPYDWRTCNMSGVEFKVVADYTNQTTEVNERNNQFMITESCHELPLLKPDLVISSLTAEGNASSVRIKARVKNVGLVTSNSSNVYLRAGEFVDTTRTFPSLAPGEEYEIQWNWIPRWSENTIEVCADEANRVDERPNETNNCKSINLSVNVSCEDGIQNRDEVMPDCGGRYCVPCGFVQLKGRIMYEDDNGLKPSRFTKFYLDGGFHMGPFLTDSDGNFTITLPQNYGGKKVYIHIDMGNVNYAARITRDLDGCNEYVWFDSDWFDIPTKGVNDIGTLRVGLRQDYELKGYWQEPSDLFCGGPIHRLDDVRSQYFNIADAILTARMYVDAHRDDDDGIGRVDVQYPDSEWSFYDDDWNEITLFKDENTDHGLEDGVVIHEYGHYLEDQIGEEDYYSGDSHHTFCGDKDDTEFAWSEGFSEYFGTFIVNKYPHLNHPDISINKIENIPCDHYGDDMESTVAGILWDLVDTPAMSGTNESFDEVDSLDGTIIEILDSELDHWYDAPDLCEFFWALYDRVENNSTMVTGIARIFVQYNVYCSQGR